MFAYHIHAITLKRIENMLSTFEKKRSIYNISKEMLLTIRDKTKKMRKKLSQSSLNNLWHVLLNFNTT